MMRLFGWLKGPLSKKVQRIIVVLTVLLYAAFFLIGYNHPFAEDPDFIEPRLTPVLICFGFFIVLVALMVTVWAIVYSMRKRGVRVKADNGLPASMIVGAVIALTVVIMLVSFWMGSTAAMSVNGKEYADTLGLRMADMFVFTSLALIVVAALVAAVSTIRSQFWKRR